MQATRILAGLAALTIAYYTVIIWFPEPGVRKYQALWDENAGKAQRYIFSSTQPAVILAGSSLSARIPEYRFDRCFTNLSLVGGAAIDSLEVARVRTHLPKLILVEANIIERPLDRGFLSEISGFLPRHFQLFRVDAKPVNFLLSSLYSLNHSKESEFARQLASKPDPRARDIGLNIERHSYNTRIDQSILDTQLTAYRRILADLKAKGVLVIFFEMPIHRTLRNSPRAVQIRQALSGAFPGVEYFNLQDFKAFGEIETTDGIHLSTSEAVRVGDVLLEKVRALLKEPGYCS